MKEAWGRRRSLVARLVAVTVALLLLGLAVGSSVLYFVLKSRLIEQIDRQLLSTAEPLGARVLEEVIKGTSDKAILPSQYYLLIEDSTIGTVIWFPDSPFDDYGSPDLTDYDFALLTANNQEPVTVPNSTGGPDWRVITVATGPASAIATGRMTIGLPLDSVTRTLDDFLRSVLIVDFLAVTAGVFLAAYSVARALRPLRHIETVAGQIAAGDLSQRVFVDQPSTTEIDSLADSLNSMLTQIEQSFANQRASEDRMRRFVADASHELRTPLATVRGYGELYRLGGIPHDELPRAFARIESETTRLSNLVTDLTQLARMDEGRAPNQSEIDLGALASDAAQDLRALDVGRPVEVISLDGRDVGYVAAWADSDHVRQIFTNLVGNVVQHTPPGTPCEIAVGLEGGYAVVEVRDHGLGVATNSLERIFERFYRVDISRSRSSGGTGLGLAIVQALVESNGGKVRALRTKGGGLTIRVSLPSRPNDAKDWQRNGLGRRVYEE